MTDFDANLKAVEPLLARYREQVTGHAIAGEMVVPPGARLFENLSPVDNTSLGSVVEGSAADVDAACAAAESAFPAWRDLPGTERRARLHCLADLLEERALEIALVESMDCGQPIRFMRQAAVRGAANFRFFADKAPEAQNGLALTPAASYQLHPAFTHRACRGDHAVEHALYVVHLENRAGARRGLYRGPQAGRAEPPDGDDPRRSQSQGRYPGRRLEHC